MRTETFKPLVLVSNKRTGAAVMFTRRYWASRADTKYDTYQVMAFADIPKDAARLWELKDKLNDARKSN